jgi:hypothetical protein
MSQAEFYARLNKINAKESDDCPGHRRAVAARHPSIATKALIGLLFFPVGFAGRVVTEMALQPEFSKFSASYWEIALSTIGFHIALVSAMLFAILKLGKARRLNKVVLMTLVGYGMATGLFAAVMYGLVELPSGLL